MIEDVVTTNDKGEQFNTYGQKLIPCKRGCGQLTAMTFTKLCDHCWEQENE